MELVIDKVSYKSRLNEFIYTFKSGKIIGLYGSNFEYLLDIINGDIDNYEGNIYLDTMIMKGDFYKKNNTKIVLIDSKNFFYTNSVYDEFKFDCRGRGVPFNMIDMMIYKYLEMVGLNANYIHRKIDTLSLSEKNLLKIAIGLIYNPDVILFKNILRGLDHNNIKKIITLMKNLKEDNKIILFLSDDVDRLYYVTDEVIILDDDKILKSGDTFEVYTSNKLMKDRSDIMPSVAKITYLAKTNKKVKLTYQRDVRDIIKDIYKHV